MSRLGVDVGGTFTDLVALAPDGAVRVTKVPSTPEDPARGLWDAIGAAGVVGIEALLHGTTVATNALLERKGARTALVTTAGFEDLLWLRRQDRAALYDLAADHPPPLVHRDDVIGVVERIGAGGVVTPLADDEVDRVVTAVRGRAPDAVAVALLFAFRDARHEARLAEALRAALPDVPIVAAAELLPVFREYERTATASAEAFLRPVVGGYVDRLRAEAGRRGVQELRVMASNGGTLAPDQARVRAAALALSGPAGGVEGARLVGRQLGEGNLLTLDMGGTSADASIVVDGEAATETAGAVGGVPLALPHVLIETVGAGGGSVAWVDAGGALRVGPESAGAVPGPACYGRGGTRATVTDAAVVLGWLDVGRPLASGLRLDGSAAAAAVAGVAAEAGLTPDRCAEGIIEVVTATMVRALRRVSVERGLDPRGMILVPFGGAGPLFTCRLADALGMRRAVVPPHPGVLSALGLAAAPARVEHVRSVHRPLDALEPAALDALYAPMERAVVDALAACRTRRVAECRYPGQGYEVAVPVRSGPDAVAEAFHAAHAERFGHADRERPVELVNARVIGIREGRSVVLRAAGGEGFAVGDVLEGPLTIPGEDSTVRLEAGWHGTVHDTGAILVERV